MLEICQVIPSGRPLNEKGCADANEVWSFTRLTREIVMARGDGGGDVDANFRLRLLWIAPGPRTCQRNIERAYQA
jgi:transcriptional/translational regulatory protein YebC/TACO1